MYHDFTSSEYVADAIIVYIREGHYPSDESAVFLDRLPLIDALRQRIGEDDVPWLLSLVENESGPAAGLACTLLRKHIHQQEVKNCLETRWNTANPYLRNRLLWRMLDDPNLSREWHRRLFNFVLEEWDMFRDFNLMFYEGSLKAVSRILSRLGDTSYPDSKKWIYFCCVPDVVEDRRAAKTLINIGLSANDEFTREVAEVLLERFFSDNSAEDSETHDHMSVKDKEKMNIDREADISGEMELAVPDFIVKAIMAHIRNGHHPGEKDADLMNRLPLIDYLRAEVTETDLDAWLLDTVKDTSGAPPLLYLSLLRKFTERDDI